tara:strand:- start:1425 stop:2360 length:936 start_codon:yes stop_codon:yes gene_type:complete
MNDYISPLDNSYISFSRAAEVIARDHPDICAKDMMVTFKYALFQGDFECTACDDRDDPQNWLHIPYHLPPGERAVAEGAMGNAAKAVETRQYYGMNLVSIISVLICEKALPGPAKAWNGLYDLSQTQHGQQIIYPWLAQFPFADYPEHGRHLIGDIRISRVRLKRWLHSRHHAICHSLQALDQKPVGKPRLKLAPSADPMTVIEQPDGHRDFAATGFPGLVRPNPVANDNDVIPVEDKIEEINPRGRPRKAGWTRIGELVRELHRADSRKLKKVLAYEAYAQALSEFPENELPSVHTIVRNMSIILKNKEE